VRGIVAAFGSRPSAHNRDCAGFMASAIANILISKLRQSSRARHAMGLSGRAPWPASQSASGDLPRQGTIRTDVVGGDGLEPRSRVSRRFTKLS